MNEKSSNREKIDKNFLENSGASASTIDAYGKSLKGFRKELNKTTKDGKEASATMKDYNEYLSKNGEETIRSTSVTKDLGAGLKNIGKTALSIGGNILIDTAISYGLTKAGEAWNNYSNKQENAIEKGNEALSKYKQTNSTMQEATSWIKDNAERYTELAKGATSLGEQGSLTDSEFKEYNELSAQMATYLPSQIKGYNSLGTAILSVGDSTKQVNNALQSEKLTQYAKSANEASDVIDKFKAEMYQNAGLTKEIGLTNQQKAIENFLADYDDKDYGGHGNKIKEAFLHRGDGMTTGMYAYLNNANLIETFKKAGIKGSSWFGQQYTQNDFLNKDNINTLRNYQQQLSTEAQTSVDAIKEIMPAFLQSNKDYLKLTDNLPEMDSMISSIYSNFDKNGVESILGGNLNDLSSEEAEKGIRDWTSNLVKDLQKKDTQDALTSLFALDDKKTKMSFNEYEKQADDAVKKVRKQTDAFTDEQLRNSSGIHDTLDQLQTDVDNITSKFSGDKGFSADKLKSDYTSSQLDALSSIATDKTFTGNWKAALNQMNSVERAAQLSADKMQKIVTTATSNLSTMQTAISESMSNTGVTADTLKSLASAVSDNVEGYDFTKKNLFAESAKGIKVNKDALSQLLEVQHKAKSTDFSDAIDKQTKAIQDQNKAVEKAKNTESYDTEKAKLQDMFDDLAKIRQARSQYNALYQQQQEALTDYADWVNAQRTENAGDKYTNMVTGLKNAQELYNKGLVGEDDFKSFAKMISPTGATDVANFEENYNKAKRYLTDNDKGVKNFLNDLKSKGLATYSDSDGWNIGDIDLKRDSRAMGIGKDFMSNKDAKDMDRVSRTEYQVTSAQRHLSIANKNVKTQQTNLTNAKKNLTATQRAILSKQKSKKTFVAQNALLDYQTSASKQENAYRQSALKAAKKNMQTYKNNIANRDKSKKALLATKGKITTAQRNAIKKNQKVDTSNIKNPKLKKQLEAYNKYVTGSNPDKGRILSNALSTAQSNADQAQAEYAAMRVTNEQEKFKNVQNYYSGWNDRYSNYTEQHQKKYEKSEAHGNYTNSKKYDTQINDLQKQRKYKQNEVTDLQKQLNASVKSGIIKKGSEEWLEMTNQILEAQNAVSDFDTQIEQAKQDKITTVYEEMFDRAIEKANRLKDKISSINDLITEDMMIDKDTGNLTEMGALSITMNSQQLDTELNNLQTYVKKRQQIMDDFANGSSKSKYGEKTYDELMSENDSAMQESLKNANNYRQSIISIVINQAKAVQDAMFKEIDARKKALKKKKEYYDYDKTIKKKTDEIELIKQQIRGLEGLTDAESKAQKARLEASLKDKQDDLDDTVRDHVYDITVNGLDDLETQLSEDFEKWSNQLSSDLAKMSDAISNAINGAGENYSDMMAGIDYILNNIGDITSGQYFTNQDKSNMKNSNSLDTGYNSGHLKGYAKGTKHVGSNRIAMTNENGREIIVTKDGWITPLEASDMVIPNDITETLIDMAERQQNYAMNGNFKMPELKVKDASGNSVNNVYNTFTVQGDLTRDTLPELNKILDLASSKTQNDIRKNKRRFG